MKTRKQGTPYYLHPFAVSELLKNKGFGVEYQITGLLHDLREDADVTYAEIVQICNVEIADAVELLTKNPGYSMQEYIKGISENDIAKMTKLADRIHNLSEIHLAPLEFREEYVAETKEWYIDLAKGTCFEEDLNSVLRKVELSLDNRVASTNERHPGGTIIGED